jgi:hypothetical protein
VNRRAEGSGKLVETIPPLLWPISIGIMPSRS